MPVPRATARLQLHKDFSLDDAAAVVPYYAALGVSHIYASPVTTARPGSVHGYDVVDPTRVNPELGGEEALRRLVARLREAGMGLILDIVPNHMGIGGENPWWQHVLEYGQSSPYAHWFDIDWSPADPTLRGKLMAPFLGQPYGEALAAGEITLRFDGDTGKFYFAYYAHRFPLAPADYAEVLGTAGSLHLAAPLAAFQKDHDLEAGFTLLRHLGGTPESAADIEAALRTYSPDTPQGQEALHMLLERQHYRLAWWRCAADGINWRRFFEINDLIGVRVEQDDVFEATHELIFRLYAEGLVDGLRIDHVDGLADPARYCRRLRQRLHEIAPRRHPELPQEPAYIIVEKILAHGEPLRQDWEVDGTTGYEFMDQVGALLHDPAGEEPLSGLWSDQTGRSASFRDEVRQARRQLLSRNLAGEFEATSRALYSVACTDLRTRDYSLGTIRRALGELLVHFPVYRTYADSDGRNRTDQQVMDRALEEARYSAGRIDGALLDQIGLWLGGEAPNVCSPTTARNLRRRAITRFQQLTPPLAAKSVEDTGFYRYGRLLSRNEVGADPGRFFLSVREFHAACTARAAQFPNIMLTTATHDHKRGEDVRARIAVLSELGREWSQAARDWMRRNASLRTTLAPEDGTPAVAGPQPADELMLYQMLVGAWPIGLRSGDADGLRDLAERLDGWQTKALREAKLLTDWMMPNEAYEDACRRFLHTLLEVREDNTFLQELADWAERLTPAGVVNSLTQTVLRLATPGVPDLYQGTDFWDFSLVDPDNRRPVDHAQRMRALGEEPQFQVNLDGWRDGLLKQNIIRHALALRAREPALFSRGEYVPLKIDGPVAEHAIAFLRRYRDRHAVVIATRLSYRILALDGTPTVPPDVWQDSAVLLPEGLDVALTDIFTGERLEAQSGAISLREALWLLPVAILEGAHSA